MKITPLAYYCLPSRPPPANSPPMFKPSALSFPVGQNSQWSWHPSLFSINTPSLHSIFSPHTYLVAGPTAHYWWILVVFYLYCTTKVGTTPAVFGHLGCLIFDLPLRFIPHFFAIVSLAAERGDEGSLKMASTSPRFFD